MYCTVGKPSLAVSVPVKRCCACSEVGAVGAAPERCPHRVERALDGGRGGGCAQRRGLRAPERPRSAVDAAIHAHSRVHRHSGIEADHLLAAGRCAVAVHALRQQVHHAGLGHLDAAFEQVNHLLLAGVLELVEARDDDRAGGLLEVELRRADHVLRRDGQQVVPRVPADVAVVGEGQLLEDQRAARHGADVAALV
jgi:hypothetical protein